MDTLKNDIVDFPIDVPQRLFIFVFSPKGCYGLSVLLFFYVIPTFHIYFYICHIFTFHVFMPLM